jgi:hypothetical protein
MNKPKRFDAVQMKNEVQAKLRRRYARMTDDERLAAMEHHLAHADSPVGRLWRDLTSRESAISKVAETPAKYLAKRKYRAAGPS